ncbi:nitrite reductase (NO-forming) [Pedobacter sp. UYP30]|uniref:copper-containing nitrite reductase n=1 Tax=Pedobacter sp. UYP30 TaxID=1756400 RepID=UPI00339B199C
MKNSINTEQEEMLQNPISRASFMKTSALVAGSSLLFGLSSCQSSPKPTVEKASVKVSPVADAAITAKPKRVAANPALLPPPIKQKITQTHKITLECTEVIGEVKAGQKFRYLTFNGQVPAPMIRVRQGDTIDLTITNPTTSIHPHNVDFHAVYGTGGGAEATMVAPGQTKHIRFKTMYPGAFIYHCAAPGLDFHISSGMFGLLLVEPPEGLPEVDHEFYFGQNEIYTKDEVDANGFLNFDYEAMKNENPNFVVLNGESYAITDAVYGAVKVKKGETARIFFVNGGPNLISSFHPIGNIWTKAWREGALANNPEKYIQTIGVSPGSCAVLEMEFPVAETIKLADHSLSRVVSKGLMAVIEVEGTADTEIFDANPKFN